jgi:hypothetical protein
MKYSVVIPERNEAENFKLTAENIMQTQKHCNDIRHVPDNQGNGTSSSRHAGTVKAINEVIITCDAHMRFKAGALDLMAQYIADNPLSLACLKCHHNETMSFDDNCYYGAEIHWKQEEPNNNRALSAKWRGSTATGEISAVMGACYGFDRRTYRKLGEPWRLGVAWGNDEETISIAIRLIGGSVVLLDGECAHQLRKVSGYQVNEADIIGVWYNRIRNLHYLPIEPATAAELQEYVLSNPDPTRRRKEIIRLLNYKMPDIQQSKSVLLNNQTISFNDYATKWIINYPKGETMARSRKTTTTTQTTTAAAVKRSILPVVEDLGLRCPHCGTVGRNYKITNTYPQSRRHICGNCERPYIVMNKFNPHLNA